MHVIGPWCHSATVGLERVSHGHFFIFISPISVAWAPCGPCRHRLMHAVTARALLFLFRLRYTFTPATLGWKNLILRQVTFNTLSTKCQSSKCISAESCGATREREKKWHYKRDLVKSVLQSSSAWLASTNKFCFDCRFPEWRTVDA